MKKSTKIILLLRKIFLLRRLLIIAFLILSSCSTNNSAIFIPNNESLINFEFRYPANWGSLQAERIFDSDTSLVDVIRIKDPSKAIPDCANEGPIIIGCDSRPTIVLHASKIDPSTRWADDHITSSREFLLAINHIELTSDRVVFIDGYKAQALTNYDSILQTSSTQVIVQVDDRGYIFFINLLSEEDLGGKFYEAFWDIIESIRFIPQSTE